ncbi:8650_t:CDS:2, partial [Ambispora gerdemannii]
MSFQTNHYTLQFAIVFAMFLLWLMTLIPIRIAQSRMLGGLDNRNPREQYQELPEWGQRAIGVNNNTFEAFCFLSVAVFTQAFSELLGNPQTENVVRAVDAFCIIFLVLRL